MNNDTKPLSRSEIDQELKTVSGWSFANNKISKQFDFANFISALNFINELAKFSEEIDHHPDIHIFYNKVIFDLQRFDAGGKVTARDFQVAKEIERRYKLTQ